MIVSNVGYCKHTISLNEMSTRMSLAHPKFCDLISFYADMKLGYQKDKKRLISKKNFGDMEIRVAKRL
jgi:hypothetical protein